MYTICLETGEVVRIADGKLVAPCQSAEEPDFVSYIAWVEEGNQPEVI